MHTRASDGFADVRDVLGHIAERKQLDVIAITDHDTLEASLWAYQHRHRYPFDIIPGVEVSSADGHILALWVTQPIRPARPLAETVAAIHQQGGIAILAHPFELGVSSSLFWHHLRHPHLILQAGIDAIETFNAAVPTPGGNWLARRLAHRLNLPVIGGSDAHTLGGIGCGLTHFPGRSATDLRAAIQKGQTRSTGHKWPLQDYLHYLSGSLQHKFNGTPSPDHVPLSRS